MSRPSRRRLAEPHPTHHRGAESLAVACWEWGCHPTARPEAGLQGHPEGSSARKAEGHRPTVPRREVAWCWEAEASREDAPAALPPSPLLRRVVASIQAEQAL